MDDDAKREFRKAMRALGVRTATINNLLRLGIREVGDARYRLDDDPASILKLRGMGPQTMAELRSALHGR